MDERSIENLVFKQFNNNPRFTQDSPIYPDVWLEYFRNVSKLKTYRVDLILIPHKSTTAAMLLKELLSRFDGPATIERLEIASNGDTVAAKMTFDELIRIALPLTNWWKNYLFKDGKPTDDFRWLARLVGAFMIASQNDKVEVEDNGGLNEEFEFVGMQFIQDANFSQNLPAGSPKLWSISRNRPATLSIELSVPATKADAGRRLFDIDGSGITWAVLDSGIDITHRAFRAIDPATKQPYPVALGPADIRASNFTRIIASYDFTRFRKLLADTLANPGRVNIWGNSSMHPTSSENDELLSPMQVNDAINNVSMDLQNGRMLDWSVIAPLLRIPHNETNYVWPAHKHGTHVAGIIAANQDPNVADRKLIGMCPGIQLYDIRVMDANGIGEEFNILAALQFVRWMNAQRDGIVIHGVNLSISMKHEVDSYACGQTPVCDACERLVSEGTVVVACAGNQGQAIFRAKEYGEVVGFRTVNITDPGNAENVITVGATHRNRPHSYGVSYFSSKGPTGDGRMKPDLVAPGEKIVSTGFDNNTERMDGTSMAAPHVSGAAALLLAKHRELIGRPKRVKEILCKTATDLGREKYFQGCGMLDVLRAIQSV